MSWKGRWRCPPAHSPAPTPPRFALIWSRSLRPDKRVLNYRCGYPPPTPTSSSSIWHLDLDRSTRILGNKLSHRAPNFAGWDGRLYPNKKNETTFLAMTTCIHLWQVGDVQLAVPQLHRSTAMDCVVVDKAQTDTATRPVASIKHSCGLWACMSCLASGTANSAVGPGERLKLGYWV